MAAPGGAGWSNWSGDVTASPQAVWRPQNEQELAGLIRGVAGPIRPAGSGHSFTPLCASNGAIVSLENMTGLIEVWPDRQEAELWAGTPVYAVGPLLHPHGLALANQGDIDRQTLGGAIGTGTHGTGIGFGSLSTMVTGVTLVTGSGEILTADRNNDPDLFDAARVSYGSLGVITRFRLKLVSSYALSEASYVEEAGKVLEKLEELAAAHRHFEFFWFPYSDKVVVKTLDIAPEKPERALDISAMKARGERVSSDSVTFDRICRVVKWLPWTSAFFHRLLTSQMAKGEAKPGRVRWSWETFPSPRTTRFNEMEFSVPHAKAADAIRAVVARIRAERIPTAFPIEFRFVKGDDIWLSPFSGRDSATLSVHQYHAMDQWPLFKACQEEFLKFEGRPHWGKQHTLTGRDFLWLYPEWRRFQSVRQRVDPENKFVSPYLRTLFETGIAETEKPH
ncbi:MAG: FAD-binding protein, partial [Alphaproteobacteria bacterium]|nr:FAD-binding protein [Alphaproteobacteria bacterium]